jgi:hypothetical protein
MMDSLEHFGGLAEADDGEEICRHEERKDRGVIAGPEHGEDEADRFGGIAVTAPCEGIALSLGPALEAVRAFAIFALLFAEGPQREQEGLARGGVARRSVAGNLPIVVSQPDRVAEPGFISVRSVFQLLTLDSSL